MTFPRTIRAAHDALAAKKLSVRELVADAFERIKACDETLHAFLSLDEENALRSADAADAAIARNEPIGELFGIPVALKDNILVEGQRTTAGSRILDTYTAAYNATVVGRLRSEGAIIIGKTNLDEFAMGSSTENSAFGPTKNPWDVARVAGGSSGGSAAAVAAGECIAALGSDTGGSIRQPASFCGVVGLKPTYGAVSRFGLIAMASSLDQIGPFARTVEDAALLFDAIKGSDSRDGSSAGAHGDPLAPHISESIKGLRIGVPKEYFGEGMDPDVEQAVRAALAEYEKLGATLVDVALPHTRYALSVYYIIMPAEVSSNLARFDGIRYGFSAAEAKSLRETYTRSRAEGFGAEARRRIMLGTYVLAAGYHDAYYKQAQKVRELVRNDFYDAFRSCDVIATPTSPILPFALGEKIDDPLTMYLADIFTVSANIAGVPGISLPCGFAVRDGKELPIGLQLLGRHFDEATLLRAAHAYERATEWHTKSPAVCD